MDRFSSVRRGALLTAATVLMGAGAAAAQDPTPPQLPQQQPQIPDSVRAMLVELQTLQQQLGALQQQALQTDTALQQKQVALEETIEAAMVEVDPRVERVTARLDTLRDEAVAAEAAQDTAGILALMQEAQQIQMTLEQAQEAAMERPEVSDAVEAFRGDLLVAMARLDPEAESLVARFEGLLERLEAAAATGG